MAPACRRNCRLANQRTPQAITAALRAAVQRTSPAPSLPSSGRTQESFCVGTVGNRPRSAGSVRARVVCARGQRPGRRRPFGRRSACTPPRPRSSWPPGQRGPRLGSCRLARAAERSTRTGSGSAAPAARSSPLWRHLKRSARLSRPFLAFPGCMKTMRCEPCERQPRWAGRRRSSTSGSAPGTGHPGEPDRRQHR